MHKEIEDGKDEFADFWDTAMMHYSKMREEKNYRTSWSIQEDHPIYRDEDSVKDSDGNYLADGNIHYIYNKTILEDGKFYRKPYLYKSSGNTFKEVWKACENLFHLAFPNDDDHVFIEAIHRTQHNYGFENSYEIILGS
jgi:predicted nuclease of restriction endonuclease-like RecB superfamily